MRAMIALISLLLKVFVILLSSLAINDHEGISQEYQDLCWQKSEFLVRTAMKPEDYEKDEMVYHCISVFDPQSLSTARSRHHVAIFEWWSCTRGMDPKTETWQSKR